MKTDSKSKRQAAIRKKRVAFRTKPCAVATIPITIHVRPEMLGILDWWRREWKWKPEKNDPALVVRYLLYAANIDKAATIRALNFVGRYARLEGFEEYGDAFYARMYRPGQRPAEYLD